MNDQTLNKSDGGIAPQDMTAHDAAPAPLSLRERGRLGASKNGKRRYGRLARRVIVATAAIALAVLAALAFRPKPVMVDVATATRGPLTVTVNETGMARVKDRYLVSASVAGSMPRLGLELGDAVKEGDVLVRIAPVSSPLLDERSRVESEARLSAAVSALGQARAQEERATAARGLSRQELDRTRALAASGAIAKQALEEAEFQDRMRAEELSSATFAAKVASEEARRARAVLMPVSAGAPREGRYAEVLAPTSGHVLRVHQKSAGVVQPGMPLIEIGDDSILEVVVDLLTTDAVHVRVGTTVTIQDWGGDHPLTGRVRQIEPSAFTRPSALGVDEQRVNVVIVFTEPRERWGELRDGYHVEVSFVLWRSDDVLKVPNGAVFRRGDSWAVYRIDHGRVRLTPVTIGHRGESEVEILSGISSGDAVAVHPGDRVKEGVSAAARNSD